MEVDEVTVSFGAVSMHGSGAPAAAIRPQASVPVEELTASFRAVTMHEVSAAAAISGQVAPVDNDEPESGEEACTLRVRFPDGRFICKSFGAARPAMALFRYCQSAVTAAGYDGPFRLVRLAGGATEEIRPDGSPLRDLGLHHCTLHLIFWV